MKKPISVSNLTLDLWLGYVRPAAMTAGILEETTENDGTREYTTEIAPEAVADEVAHCMYCACMNSHIYNNDYTKEGEAKQMLYQLSVSMKYDLHDTAEDVTKLYNALSAMLGPDRPTDSTHAEEETETEAAPDTWFIAHIKMGPPSWYLTPQGTPRRF